jgi:bacitracin synthase 3
MEKFFVANESLLLSSQSGFIFESKINDHFYNVVPIYASIKGHIDLDKFIQSIKVVCSNNYIIQSGIFDKSDISNAYEIFVAQNIDEAESYRKQLKMDPLGDHLYSFVVVPLSEFELSFLILFHHVAGDRQSIELFLNELIAEYCESPTKSSDKNYFNAVNAIKGRQKSAKKDFWIDYFSGVDIDRENGSIPSPMVFSTRRVDTVIEEQAVTNLKLKSRELRCTRQSIVLAAFSLAISAVFDKRQHIIGMPLSLRDNDMVESVMGPFIETLPIIVAIKSHKFSDIVKAVFEDTINIYENKYCSLQDIVSLTGKKSDSKGIFPCVFSWSEEFKINNGKLEVHLDAPSPYHSILDYTLIAHECDKSLYLAVDYNDGILSLRTANKILNYLKYIIENINLVFSVEIDNLVRYLTSDREPIDPDNTYYNDYLLNTIIKNWHQPFCKSFGERYNFSDLYGSIICAQLDLQKKGLVPSDTIALCMRGRVEFVSYLLAGIYSGINVALIDDLDNYKSIEDKLEIINAKLLVCDFNINFKSNKILVENVNSCDLFEVNKEQFSKGVTLSPEHGNILIFTSGTTARPKPVIVRYQSVVDYAIHFSDVFKITSNDKILQFCSTGFDASLEEIFSSLVSGAFLVFKISSINYSTLDFIDFCNDEEITIIDLPTAYFKLLVNEGLSKNNLFRSVRCVVIGGEELTSEVFNLWKEIQRNYDREIILANTYGPTETTIVASIKLLTEDFIANQYERISIGNQRKHSCLYLLDDKFDVILNNDPGELYIGGECVNKGYLGLAGVTAEKFMPDPFSPNPGARMYKTGDYAKLNKDGEIVYLGRKDRQIKINGRRIELSEYEFYLRNKLGIAAIAISFLSSEGDNILGIVIETQNHNAEDSVNSALREHYPDYLLPKVVVSLKNLPIGFRGKTELNVLRDYLRNIYEGKGEIKDDSKSLEEVVLNTARQMLGVDSIQLDDCFFNSGGHSILALRFCEKLNKTFNTNISARKIFTSRTFRNISLELHSQGASLTFLSKNEVIKTDVKMLSSVSSKRLLNSFEMSIYLSQQRFIDDPLYVLREEFIVEGSLQLDRLNKAVEAVCKYNPILRSIISYDGDYFWQEIDFESAMSNIYSNTFSNLTTIFDLDRCPPFRFSFNCISESMTKLVIEAHHIAVDGYSFKKAIEQIAYAYNDLENAIQDFSLLDMVDNQDKNDHLTLEWWKDYLLPVTDFNFKPCSDFQPVSGSISSSAHTIFRPVDSLAIKNLMSLSGENSFIVSLALTFLWISRISASNNIVIFTPVSSGDLDNTAIRSNVRLLPVFIEINKNDGILSCIQKVKNKVIDIIENRNISELDLVGLFKDLKSIDYKFPPIIFDLIDGQFNSSFRLDKLSTNYIKNTLNSVRGDLEVSVQINSGVYQIELRGRKSLYDEASLINWALLFNELLLQCAETSDFSVSAPFSIINNDLMSTKGSFSAYEYKESDIFGAAHFLKLIEQKAQANSSNLLVLEGEKSLTGADLSRKTDAIKNFIIDRVNKKPQPLVAVILSRSMEFVLAILGVWKAGGVVILIDSNSPSERLELMLQAFDIDLIISDKGTVNGRATITVKEMQNSYNKNELSSFSISHSKSAYVTFTSGSTGTPKPIICSWWGLLNLLFWSQKNICLTSDDRFLHTSSSGFDISLWEVLHPLFSGALLDILPYSMQGDIGEIIEYIDKRDITSLHLVPSLLNPIMQALRPNECRKLRNLVVGGEAVPIHLFHTVQQKLDVNFYHTYGPSETSIFVMCWKADKYTSVSDRLPLGDPIDHVMVSVVDKYGNLLPKGSLGELCISGSALSFGYYALSSQTASSFQAQEHGARRYHTGDLVIHRANNKLEFLGRKDRQLKINGVRFEPYEIESALESVNVIKKAVVALTKDRENFKLVAFLLVEKNDVDKDEIISLAKRELNNKIPKSLVPKDLILLDEFPLNINGKVDVNKLVSNISNKNKDVLLEKENKSARVPDSRSGVNATRQDIYGIFSEFLSVSSVKGTDNYFDLGGDSIIAIRIIARLRREGVKLSLKDIFSAESIDSICEKIDTTPLYERAGHGYKQITSKTITPQSEGDGIFFLPPAAHLWAQQCNKNLIDGVQTVVFKIPDYPVEKIERVFQGLLDKHASLRQFLVLENGCWKVIVSSRNDDAPAICCQCIIYDEKEIDSISAFVRDRIDPRNGSNLKAAKFYYGNNCYLLLGAHHLSLDWYSWVELLKGLLKGCQSDDIAMSSTSGLHDGYCQSLLNFSYEVGQELACSELRSQDKEKSRNKIEYKFHEQVLGKLRNFCASSNISLAVAISYLASHCIACVTGVNRVNSAIEKTLRDNFVGQERHTLGWFTDYDIRTFEKNGEPTINKIIDYSAKSCDFNNQHIDLVCNVLVDNMKRELSELDSIEYIDEWSNLDIDPHHKLALELIFGENNVVVTLDADNTYIDDETQQNIFDLLIQSIAKGNLFSYEGSSLRYPLIPLQKSILSECLKNEGSDIYHTQIIYQVIGNPDFSRLKKAWQLLHEEYDVFRMAFSWDDEFYQYISESVEMIWHEIRDEDHALDKVLELALKDCRSRPFDLSKAPLSRLMLIYSSERAFLVWSHHHILFDGWSLPLVTEAISNFYTSLTAKDYSDTKALSYLGYLNQYRTLPETKQMEGIHASRLLSLNKPCLLGKSNVPSLQHKTEAWELDEELSGLIRKAAKKMRTTVGIIIQSTWALVLAKLTGSHDVAYGLVSSGRGKDVSYDNGEIDQMIGFCLNTSVVVLNLKKEDDFKSVLKKIIAQLVEILECPTISLTNVLSECRLKGMQSSPFNTLLVYENYPGDKTGSLLGNDGSLMVVNSIETSEMPWVFVILQNTRTISFELIYKSNQFNDDLAKKIKQLVILLLNKYKDF